MAVDQIVFVLLGALAGGIVNGLTGFGTAITAMGLWLYAISPTTAASLAIICSVVSQFQTFPMIWRTIRWRRVLPFIVPGLLGVPIGTALLPHIEPRYFKIGIGGFLIAYSVYVLARRMQTNSAWGGSTADGVIGFGGGVLGGLTGLSGVFPVVWIDIRGWTKEEQRSVIQTFNITILSMALVSHALSGLLTREVALVTAIALPATIAGAWFGSHIYRKLADRGYKRVVMMLLLLSGIALIWTSL